VTGRVWEVKAFGWSPGALLGWRDEGGRAGLCVLSQRTERARQTLHSPAPRPPVDRFAALQPAKPHTPVQHTIFEYPLLRWVDVAGSKVAARPSRRAAARSGRRGFPGARKKMCQLPQNQFTSHRRQPSLCARTMFEEGFHGSSAVRLRSRFISLDRSLRRRGELHPPKRLTSDSSPLNRR